MGVHVGESGPADIPITVAQALQRSLSSPKLIVTVTFRWIFTVHTQAWIFVF